MNKLYIESWVLVERLAKRASELASEALVAEDINGIIKKYNQCINIEDKAKRRAERREVMGFEVQRYEK